MELLTLLYKILKIAASSFDREEIPSASELYTSDVLKANQEQIETMICQAYKGGYLDGVRVIEIDGMTKPKVLLSQSHIILTIKGMEYISENTSMKKIAKTMKGIKEMIPGM